MSNPQRSKNHHWWPVGLQRYWTDKKGYVSWIETERPDLVEASDKSKDRL